jgi:hypothetical protein
MKMLLVLPFIFSLSAFAENSRSPAVLDGSCNLNIPTTMKVMVNGKESVIDRPIEDVLKDQCKEVKKCMNSAEDEEMEELKSLEAVACNNTLNAVTTKTPGMVVDKNFDGKRKAKPTAEPEIISPAVVKPVTTIK